LFEYKHGNELAESAVRGLKVLVSCLIRQRLPRGSVGRAIEYADEEEEEESGAVVDQRRVMSFISHLIDSHGDLPTACSADRQKARRASRSHSSHSSLGDATSFLGGGAGGDEDEDEDAVEWGGSIEERKGIPRSVSLGLVTGAVKCLLRLASFKGVTSKLVSPRLWMQAAFAGHGLASNVRLTIYKEVYGGVMRRTATQADARGSKTPLPGSQYGAVLVLGLGDGDDKARKECHEC